MKSESEAIKGFAGTLGFGLAGIAGVEDFARDERAMLERIGAGMMGDMRWLTPERARLACRPRDRFPWVKSLVALAVPYYPSEENARKSEIGPRAESDDRTAASTPRGRVSRYALGADYHAVIGERLSRLADFVTGLASGARARGYVDTGPVAERAVAARAGLGWIGKNTNLLTPRHGSWVFLAVLLTSLELAPDEPLRKSCGDCKRCLEACPTGALVAPYALDARRCISYLTIESRAAIPRELRPLLGDLVFGCDICQEVCPVNAKAATGAWPALAPGRWPGATPSLPSLLALDEGQFRRRFGATALWRAKRSGLQRNVAVALGNSGRSEAVRALMGALDNDSPLVRGHAAWALGRIGGQQAYAALRARARGETDGAVREELALAQR